MAIRDTYSELIIEDIIKEILIEGSAPSASEITTRYEDFIEDNDISEPLFIANNYQVEYGEISSVSKYNNTNSDIQRDLKVLYRHLFKISEQCLSNFERWRTEAKMLEGRLDNLNERVASLLLLASDTAGYFNFMQDNFVDNNKVDLANTTAYVDVVKGMVRLGTSTLGATRVDLNELRDEDIEFTVLSRNNLVSTVSLNNSRTKYVVTDINNYWQERVYTSKPGPISIELKINLQENTEISRIDIDLHMANQNSTAQVTPMYSTDNYNWNQLPINNFTRSIIDKTIFQFTPITAKWVKFIITKTGFDQVHNELYSYEFGVDEISFYNEGFATNTTATLISQPLFVNDINGNPEQFSRIVLEVCEDIPDNTSIDYYISASNDSSMSAEGFTPIDPLNRVNTTKPTVLDFGDLDTVTVSNILVSYDATATSGVFMNPGQSFTLIGSVSDGSAVTYSGQSSATRYSFFSSRDRILNHCVASGIQMAQGTLELWRNVNTQGDNTKVRGYANGWGFEDPYYQTTVYVDNAVGHNVDFGGNTVVIDGIGKTGYITLERGRHTIWVHKDNWKAADFSGVIDLATLKAADSLYPYNHRYLVEGISYPSNWPDTVTKVYRGFDIVAQFFMKEVSIFDLINNIAFDDYNKFALDLDAEDTNRLLDGIAASSIYQSSNTVFVIKVDESNPDFVNERFVLRFKSANSLFKYLRFKAVLETEDSTITPFLDSYRIKISS